MYEPPAGYDDCEADGEDFPTPEDRKFHAIAVEDVGVIHARKPLPNAIPALAGAANAKIDSLRRVDYLDVFVQNHLAPGEFEGLLHKMMEPDGNMPPDAMLRVSRAIATAGTGRPTRPSSCSH